MSKVQQRNEYNRELTEKVSAAMELVDMIDPDDILHNHRAMELVRIICGPGYSLGVTEQSPFSIPILLGARVMTIDGKPGIVGRYKPLHENGEVYTGAIINFDDGTSKHFRISELLKMGR